MSLFDWLQIHYTDRPKEFKCSFRANNSNSQATTLVRQIYGYVFTIEYKSGKENVVADDLTHYFYALSSPHADLVDHIHAAVNADPELAMIYNHCLLGIPTDPNYQGKHNLFLKSRLVVPLQQDLINMILLEFHSSPLGGHAGIARTKAIIASQFFGPQWHKISNNLCLNV